jgi:hypothetical protein
VALEGDWSEREHLEDAGEGWERRERPCIGWYCRCESMHIGIR